MPCGRLPTGIVATLLKSSVRNTLHLVQAADRDIGEAAMRVAREIDVVGDRPGVERLEQVERRLRVEHLRLADILQREPHLFAVGRRGDVRAERAGLLHLRDDLVVGDGDDIRLRD